MSEENSSGWKRILLKWSLAALLIGASLIVLFIASVYLGFWGALPNDKTLANISHSQSTRVFDQNNELIGKYYLFDRTSVKYEDLPEDLIQALVATEDSRFYEHKGIDYRSLLRVLVKTLIMGDRSAGGGSTISQQLAKNLFPREDHSKLGLVLSKIKEAITATRLEDIYSKDDILTLYLNTVSFPDNTFGIESASRKFYSKSTSSLTLQEAATLVGTLKATYTYNPRIHPDKSHQRRNVVLSQMVKYDYLHPDDYDLIKEESTPIKYAQGANQQETAAYFLEQVRLKARTLIEKQKKEDGSQYNLYSDGLKIYTTLDLGIQKKAEAALARHMPTIQKSFESNWGNQAPWKVDATFVQHVIRESQVFKNLQKEGLSEAEIMEQLQVKKNMTLFDWSKDKEGSFSSKDSLLYYAKMLNAGFLAMDPKTGGFRAWIGGVNHDYYKYDHVNQAKRQVGSTFKPFVYAAALESGVEPCDRVSGKTVTYTNFDNWTPSNGTDEYDDKYLSMQAALTKSINTIAVKMMEKAGVDRVMELAEEAGIESQLPRVPSLALGTASLTMKELAEAYGIFVNQGQGLTGYMIERIEDADGQVIYQHEFPESKDQVLSDYTYQVMQQLLMAVTQSGGTGSRLRWKYGLETDIAGKTGTTQSNRDGWFVGATPKLLTVSWVGADDSRLHFKDTQYGQGANSALPIFGLFYQSLISDPKYRSITQAKFPAPDEEVVSDLECEGVEEENFIQGLFNKEGKPKEKSFDQEDIQLDSTEVKEEEPEEDQGLFKRVRKLFKKKD
ncbi:transglycosylase domain-containing protein [Reichenbachiella ulvae]|uniref:Transglycosylase domain-containing protein n=1 Tax=Reichenbachiella ulvae TaxID=2980104 RepID=A0ABT3CS38_9BACT|nr:transglycosylase domain-containing protein [Reichenbachiella ulvae]MCV9386083.1 transglycosylase domain-containing protein [Reichenbachiella ulvae]